MKKRLKPIFPTHILDERFKPAESVQNMGVMFDCDFYFKNRWMLLVVTDWTAVIHHIRVYLKVT